MHEAVRECVAIFARHHERLAAMHDDVAEPEDVRADDRRLTRHGFEQRDAERGFGGGTRIHGAVRVIRGAPLENRTDKRNVRVAGGLSVVVLAQRSVAHDDQLRATPASLYALEGVDERRQPIARVEASEEEYRRNVRTDFFWPRNVGLEQIRVDAIGNDLPIGVEVSLERNDGRL